MQYTVAPPDARDVTTETFDPATNKAIRQTKLRVLLVRLSEFIHHLLSSCIQCRRLEIVEYRCALDSSLSPPRSLDQKFPYCLSGTGRPAEAAIASTGGH